MAARCIVLTILDWLRAHHVDYCAYEGPTPSSLNEFAAKRFWFVQAISLAGEPGSQIGHVASNGGWEDAVAPDQVLPVSNTRSPSSFPSCDGKLTRCAKRKIN